MRSPCSHFQLKRNLKRWGSDHRIGIQEEAHVILVGIAFLVCFAIGQERASHGIAAAFLGNESLVV